MAPFLRMSPELFEHLLRLVAPISKKKAKLQIPTGPAERLYLTLRYLPSGDSQQVAVISFSYFRIFIFSCCILFSYLQMNRPESTGPKL